MAMDRPPFLDASAGMGAPFLPQGPALTSLGCPKERFPHHSTPALAGAVGGTAPGLPGDPAVIGRSS